VRHALAVILLLSLIACVSVPDAYRPPIERKPLVGGEVPKIGEIVTMNEDAAAQYIVRDVSFTADPGQFRWTGESPTLRFMVPKRDGWKLLLEFFIADATMPVTGPFHITYSVNGHVLDKVLYSASGHQRFEKPVPAEWLSDSNPTIVMAQLDKTYIAESDKKKLGVILRRAGFIR
jgi:hypothetical protein